MQVERGTAAAQALQPRRHRGIAASPAALRECQRGQRDERKDDVRDERVYLTMALPMKRVVLECTIRSPSSEHDAQRFDALLDVGELLHRHRRWPACDFHQHGLELVQ